MTGHSDRMFLPAAGRDWLLPLYDPLTRLFGFDAARRELVAQAALQPLHRVLDIGCGTGAVAILTRTLHPAVQVTALDPDPKALARAARKAQRAGVSIQWDRGFSDALPYRDATFHRVFSSMMFHHLERGDKERTLREVRRVLEPGGRLHMLDFKGPDEPGASGFARRIHSHRQLRDNSERTVLAMLSAAGFADVRRVAERRMSLFGTVAYYRASRPV